MSIINYRDKYTKYKNKYIGLKKMMDYSMPTRQYHDIIIVGGGTAGSILAARISENPALSVMLLEAGNDYTKFPKTLLDSENSNIDKKFNWIYCTEKNMSGHYVELYQGKVIGGSSTHNECAALRARKVDFNDWPPEWSFSEALSYYKKIENTGIVSHWHNDSGPMHIEQLNANSVSNLCKKFVQASVNFGLKLIPDFNAATQNGVGFYPKNIINGIRQNTALVYLTKQVRARLNLKILGNSMVDVILFEKNHANAVRLIDGTIFFAKKEIIVSAGALGSPQILMRSGIGLAKNLQKLGIKCLSNLPIGLKLFEHPFYYMEYALKKPVRDDPSLGALIWTHSNILNQSLDSDSNEKLDLQIASWNSTNSDSISGHTINFGVALTDPKSVGNIKLVSSDPHIKPLIDLNFFSNPSDLPRLAAGVQLVRHIVTQSPLREMIERELLPGPDIDVDIYSDIINNIDAFHHVSGTVFMGNENSEACVDSFGSVRGIDGLRVVDASIIPAIPSCPINLTVIMMAERICDYLKKNWCECV